MTTPLTGTPLTNQRAVNRWKSYHLAVSHPNSVFTARINQATIVLNGGCSDFGWDGGTGTYTDVKTGMSCYVGSAAGLFDIGIVRMRLPLSLTRCSIGTTSGIQLADNQYLTFVDDFNLWQKETVATDTTTFIDHEQTWTAISAAAPIVRAGPLAVVLVLTGATVAYSPTATIYSPTGATAASYVWTGTGTSGTANLTTATPTFTYNATGEHYISCVLTDSAGGVSTIYRKIFIKTAGDAVISPPDISGDVDSGGFTCRIEGYTGVDIAALHDRALCVVWKKDYASTALATSYGPYSGAESVRFVGWLAGETLSIDPVTGAASFTIEGPAGWLDRLTGSPMEITSATATTWNKIATLNTDKALHRLVHHQTTLDSITDVTLTGDTTAILTAIVNTDSLRGQIDGLAGEKLNARICFDPYGCGFVTIPASLRTSAGKSANTVLWDLASTDWIEQIDIERVTDDKVAKMEISGSSYLSSIEASLYSRAFGTQHGSEDAPISTLAFGSQAIANQLAGDMLAAANSEYPSVGAKLYWANDYAGWAMAQGWLTRLTLVAADTPRQIVWTNKRFVIEAVSYDYDPETGIESTGLELSEETTGTAGFTYYPPVPASGIEYVPPLPPGGIGVFPGFPPFPNDPPEYPPPPAGACNNDLATVGGATFLPSSMTGTDAVLSSYFYYPCKIRDGTGSADTYIEVDLTLYGDAGSNLTCYAVDNARNRVLTGSMALASEYGTGIYSGKWRLFFTAPPGGLDVAGFEIALAAGTGVGTDALDITFVDGYFASAGSQGTTNSITNTQVVDEPNVIGFSASLNAHGTGFDSFWDHVTRFDVPTGSVGEIYAWFQYTNVSGSVYRQFQVYKNDQAQVDTIPGTDGANFDGYIKLYAITIPVDGSFRRVNAKLRINFPSVLQDFNINFFLNYMYLASVPIMRHVKIDNGLIYNVCAVTP